MAGDGFFTDSFDAFAVSLLALMLGIVCCPGVRSMPPSSNNATKLAASAGTVMGRLTFGSLADHVGRKRMYGLELIVIISAIVGQALSSLSPWMDAIGLIIFWRVLRGIGIDGDCPFPALSLPSLLPPSREALWWALHLPCKVSAT